MTIILIFIFLALISILAFFIPELSTLWIIIFTIAAILITGKLFQKKIMSFLGFDPDDSQDHDSCINYSDGKF